MEFCGKERKRVKQLRARREKAHKVIPNIPALTGN
jgi:hypothetical protein